MIKIEAMKNGPYKIEISRGYFKVEGQDEKGKIIYLCRCGHSKNKPFCDGTHNKTGFQADKTTIVATETET